MRKRVKYDPHFYASQAEFDAYIGCVNKIHLGDKVSIYLFYDPAAMLSSPSGNITPHKSCLFDVIAVSEDAEPYLQLPMNSIIIGGKHLRKTFGWMWGYYSAAFTAFKAIRSETTLAEYDCWLIYGDGVETRIAEIVKKVNQ
jgi:hypothetical protein